MTYVCVCIYIYCVYIYIYVYTYIYIYTYYVCVCVYIYIYTHIMYIYIYTYTYTHSLRRDRNPTYTGRGSAIHHKAGSHRTPIFERPILYATTTTHRGWCIEAFVSILAHCSLRNCFQVVVVVYRISLPNYGPCPVPWPDMPPLKQNVFESTVFSRAVL